MGQPNEPSVDAARFPRVARYLASLPNGYASYPECQCKATLFRTYFEAKPFPAFEAGSLPEGLLKLFAEPPRMSAWIPEVAMMSFNWLCMDVFAMSEADYLDHVFTLDSRNFAGPIYRILLTLASPGLLLAAAGARWHTFHRGSELDVVRSQDRGASVRLTFPQSLYDETLLKGFAQSMRAALVASSAKNPQVKLTGFSDRHGDYEASW